MKLSSKPRIAYIADPNFSNPYSSPLAGIPDALEILDLDFIEINPATVTFESFRCQIEKFKPELLLGVIQLPKQIEKIGSFLDRYHPVPATNWNLEDPNGVFAINDSCSLFELSRSYDIWFGIDSRMISFWPTEAAFIPPAFDEFIFEDKGIERCYDVSYIGQLGHGPIVKMYWPYMKELSRYGKKAMLSIDRPMGVPLLPKRFERFLRSKKRRRFLQKLPFWKCGWSNPQNEQEKALIVNKSKIHFGIRRVRGEWEEEFKARLPEYPLDGTGLFYQLKARLFQTVGGGAMVLNEYTPELDELFDVGKEIITFQFGDFEDIRDKLSWYISHDSERERIARAGYDRGRKQHTYSVRVQQMLDIVRKKL